MDTIAKRFTIHLPLPNVEAEDLPRLTAISASLLFADFHLFRMARNSDSILKAQDRREMGKARQVRIRPSLLHSLLSQIRWRFL